VTVGRCYVVATSQSICLLQGFQRVADSLEKDIAATRERFETVVTEACRAGWLDDSFQEGYVSANGGVKGCSLPTPETQVGPLLKPYLLGANNSADAAAKLSGSTEALVVRHQGRCWDMML
jgi:hypothetical protein